MDLSKYHTRLIVFLLLIEALIFSACSGTPQAANSADTLNLVAGDPTADTFTPKAVLTIAPTKNPLPTASLHAPTATQEVIPTEIVIEPTETPLFSEPTATQQALSSCPQGCSEPLPDCLIKGNINNEGVKIYHSPKQDYYEQTKISPEKGERWFCTSTEAEANGWRPSKR
jgi:hypothetical protein